MTHRQTLGFPRSEHVISCAEGLVDSGCPMAAGVPRLPQEAFGCHVDFVFELGGSDSLAKITASTAALAGQHWMGERKRALAFS